MIVAENKVARSIGALGGIRGGQRTRKYHVRGIRKVEYAYFGHLGLSFCPQGTALRQQMHGINK